MLLENYYEASGEIVEKADKLLSDVEYTHDRYLLFPLSHH